MYNKSKRIMAIGLVFSFLLFLSTGYLAQATKDTRILISPSGDTTGITDANTIEQALRTIPQGGTVELKKGQFYVSRIIEVEGFAGTLKGAGKDKTIIEVVKNSEAGSYLFYDPYYDATITTAFLFLNPFDVQISDLTVEVNEANPADLYFNPWAGPGGFWGDWVTAINNIFYIMATSIPASAFDTTLTQIRIKGASGDFLGRNIAYSIYIRNHAATKESVHVVEYCDFENIGATGLEYNDIAGSSLRAKSNTFKNLGHEALVAYICNYVVFCDNTITNCQSYSGMWIYQCNGGLIYNNHFYDNTPLFWSGAASIVIRNSSNLLVSQNEFVNSRGIILYDGSNHNVIMNNNYRQSGLPGWEKPDVIPNAYGCVWLGTSFGIPELGIIFSAPPPVENLIIEWRFPEGTSLAEQVLDEGEDNLIL